MATFGTLKRTPLLVMKRQQHGNTDNLAASLPHYDYLYKERKGEKEYKIKKNKKTYNSRDSLVVTHPTTNLPACGFSAVNRALGAARVSNGQEPLYGRATGVS